MLPVISINDLDKTYASGFQALSGINLDIQRGEILALLGPNGAGKTTLISIICGLLKPTSGRVLVAGHDVIREFRKTRSMIGMVPQELVAETFESVWATVSFSRGLFGKPEDRAYVEKTLRSLSLWDKRDSPMISLSGGMKRRVLIAKALVHEPEILFLDEPTAGVDVELRRDMWALVHSLRAAGVTIILTTHYIEEAEEMADRIAVINHGRIILVDDKTALIKKLGSKRLVLNLQALLERIPGNLADFALELTADGMELVYTYDAHAEHTGIAALLAALSEKGIRFHDVRTTQSSLEDIFVSLVKRPA